jgi:hypothetical protein
MGSIMFGIFSSCQKSIDSENLPNSTQENNVRVEEGYLVFENFEDFTSYREKMSKMTSYERQELEKKLGFISLATLYENLSLKVEKSQTIDEITKLLIGYEDVFEYSENGLKYKKANEISSIHINRNGFFRIGKAYYRSIDNGSIISTVKNLTLLNKINTVSEYLNLANNDILIDRFESKDSYISYRQSLLQDAGPYSSGSNLYYLLSVRNESNNRRLYVDLTQQFAYYMSYNPITGAYDGFRVKWITNLGFTHRKKGTFGIWSLYTSPTYIAEVKLNKGEPYGWNNIFSGTLNNNASSQSLSVSPYFGFEYDLNISAQGAANWVEPIYSIPTIITATGNGQNWYTNTYL